MENKEKLKNTIKDSIKKMENMIKNNKSSEEIYKEKKKLDILLEKYLREK